MKRGQGLTHDPAKALERRLRREQRRASEGPRPEDAAREARRTARETAKTAALSDRLAERRRERARMYAARKAAAARVPRVEWDVKTKASVCAMCGSNVNVTGHHIIPLRMLKVAGVPQSLWYSPLNHLPLCDEPSPQRCHKRHELYVRRVPRDVVLAKAPGALDFADEVGLLHAFDREYPVAYDCRVPPEWNE